MRGVYRGMGLALLRDVRPARLRVRARVRARVRVRVRVRVTSSKQEGTLVLFGVGAWAGENERDIESNAC